MDTTREGCLLDRRGLFGGLLAAALAGALEGLTLTGLGGLTRANDFCIYWGSIRLLGQGHDPYDLPLLAATVQAAGCHALVGTGYSYPLLFAYVLLPLGLLTPTVAWVVFTVLSLGALGLGVALLLTPLGRLAWWELALLAAGAGTFAPVLGSIQVGQANLLLLPLLALAFRGRARAASLAVATAVKLYPLAGLLAFLPRGGRERLHLAAGLVGAAVLAVVPNLVGGAGAGPLVALFGPDTYWTNQSINGELSRLALPLGSLPPLLPGLPVTAAMLAACAGLGGLTLALVLALRGRPWGGCLALLLCYAAVAAPHDSLWNFAPLLLAFAWCWPAARRRPLLLVLLAAGWLLIELQVPMGALGPTLFASGGPPELRLLSSLALYGGLLVGGVLAYVLVVGAPPRRRDVD